MFFEGIFDQLEGMTIMPQSTFDTYLTDSYAYLLQGRSLNGR